MATLVVGGMVSKGLSLPVRLKNTSGQPRSGLMGLSQRSCRGGRVALPRVVRVAARAKEGGAAGLSGGGIPVPSRASGKVKAVLPSDILVEGEENAGGLISFEQALFNSVNILLGVGLLTVPYALEEGGWASLGVLALLWNVTKYTGKLLAKCQDTACEPWVEEAAPLEPLPDGTMPLGPACKRLQTYEDIGEAAFGGWGRSFITTVLYTELLGTCGLFYILEGDHLELLFASTGITDLQFMALSALFFIPTTWLKDLSALSYVGLLGGVSALGLTGVIVGNFINGGFIDHLAPTELIHFTTLPTTFGILAFVFAGHAVFPGIAASMEEPERFPEMLDYTYWIVGAVCLVVGVTGYLMYGPNVLEEVTLNLPPGALSTAATALILISPLTKFALTLDPVARGVERKLGLDIRGEGLSPVLARGSRTALGAFCLLGATSLPFFGAMMALLGSFLTLVVSVIFPSLCYLKLYDGQIDDKEKYFNYFVVVLGVFCAATGTWTAIESIVNGTQVSGL